MKWHRLPQKANIIFSIKYSRPILGLLILEKNGKINIYFLLPYLCDVIRQKTILASVMNLVFLALMTQKSHNRHSCLKVLKLLNPLCVMHSITYSLTLTKCGPLCKELNSENRSCRRWLHPYYDCCCWEMWPVKCLEKPHKLSPRAFKKPGHQTSH